MHTAASPSTLNCIPLPPQEKMIVLFPHQPFMEGPHLLLQSAVQYCTVQSSIVLHSSELYCSAASCTVLYCTPRHSTRRHSTPVLYCTPKPHRPCVLALVCLGVFFRCPSAVHLWAPVLPQVGPPQPLQEPRKVPSVSGSFSRSYISFMRSCEEVPDPLYLRTPCSGTHTMSFSMGQFQPKVPLVWASLSCFQLHVLQ